MPMQCIYFPFAGVNKLFSGISDEARGTKIVRHIGYFGYQ